MQLLLDYHWPGNIRELQNVIERAAILSNGQKLVVKKSLISSGIQSAREEATATAIDQPPENNQEEILSLTEMEKQHILKVLEKCHWTIAGKGGAADKLDLPASTLRSKMKKLGIQRPK